MVFMQFITDDLQNQGAMSLAREVDPSGLRTIGNKDLTTRPALSYNARVYRSLD